MKLVVERPIIVFTAALTILAIVSAIGSLSGSKYYPPLIIEDATGTFIKGYVYEVPWNVQRSCLDFILGIVWAAVIFMYFTSANENRKEFWIGLGTSFMCVIFVAVASGFQVYVDTLLAVAFAATAGGGMGIAKKTGWGIGSFGFGSIVGFSFIALFAEGIFPGLVLGVALMLLFCISWVLGRSGFSIFRLIRPVKAT